MDQENRMPLIGDKAPSFEAVTTQGPIKFPEDYAGKWVMASWMQSIACWASSSYRMRTVTKARQFPLE